jgi:HK97 family phage prohead protease
MANVIKLPEVERRFVTGEVKIEKREGQENSRMIVGYAFKYNSLSKDLGGFQERIAPGALEGVDLSDVVALFNHDPNYILARMSAKTLSLPVDEIGLPYQFDAPATTAGNDLLENVRLRNVSGSSFAFIVEETKWEEVNGIYIRNILKFKKIIDVSPVVFPAYDETEVGKRSLDSYKKGRTDTTEVRTNLELSKTLVEMAKL